MVGGVEIGIPPRLWPRKPFFVFLHSPWAWLCSAHGSITMYSITGFFSLILLPNFLSGAFSGLYFSSFSLVERRRVATHPLRSEWAHIVKRLRTRAWGRLGSSSWARELLAAPTTSLPSPSFCSYGRKTPFFFLSYLLCVTLSTEVSAGCLNTLLALEFFHRGSDKVGEPLARGADWRASWSKLRGLTTGACFLSVPETPAEKAVFTRALWRKAPNEASSHRATGQEVIFGMLV